MASLKSATYELAPAMDSEPIFERPSAERWQELERELGPPAFEKAHSPMGVDRPSGVWADARSGFGMDAAAGAAFLDPGTFALSSHSTPMMESASFATGALDVASADLYTAPSASRSMPAQSSAPGATGGVTNGD